MRYLLSLGVMMAWALWFGGLMTLFLAVVAVFHALGRTAEFSSSTRAIFGYFGLYQMLLGSFSMFLCVLWLIAGRTSGKWQVLGLFIAASVLAVVSIAYVTPHLLQHLPTDEVFGKLHRASMILHVAESVLLLLAGFLLPLEIGRELRGYNWRGE